MRFLRFNANDNVRVRLTETGKKILAQSGFTHLTPDADGWIRIQGWKWAMIFGPHFFLGGEPPTGPEMYIEVAS